MNRSQSIIVGYEHISPHASLDYGPHHSIPTSCECIVIPKGHHCQILPDLMAIFVRAIRSPSVALVAAGVERPKLCGTLGALLGNFIKDPEC